MFILHGQGAPRSTTMDDLAGWGNYDTTDLGVRKTQETLDKEAKRAALQKEQEQRRAAKAAKRAEHEARERETRERKRREKEEKRKALARERVQNNGGSFYPKPPKQSKAEQRKVQRAKQQEAERIRREGLAALQKRQQREAEEAAKQSRSAGDRVSLAEILLAFIARFGLAVLLCVAGILALDWTTRYIVLFPMHPQVRAVAVALRHATVPDDAALAELAWTAHSTVLVAVEQLGQLVVSLQESTAAGYAHACATVAAGAGVVLPGCHGA